MPIRPFLLLGVSVALAIGAAGCGSKETNNTPAATTPATTATTEHDMTKMKPGDSMTATTEHDMSKMPGDPMSSTTEHDMTKMSPTTSAP